MPTPVNNNNTAYSRQYKLTNIVNDVDSLEGDTGNNIPVKGSVSQQEFIPYQGEDKITMPACCVFTVGNNDAG